MTMVQHRYTVTFLTPAFLGDAEQNARWRTPPFKHLLREWWRVAWAEANGFPSRAEDITEMRKAEGHLFGNAWLKDDFCKSKLRMRLANWQSGSLRSADWPAELTVRHPEVNGGMDVGSSLYLGFGPLAFDRQLRRTTLKKNAAIQAGEHAELSLAWPKDDPPLIERAIVLASRYGALGGRSRNGWGSMEFSPTPTTTMPMPEAGDRHWTDCLDRDWPHAMGKDRKGPLIWQTQPHDSWRSLMQTLASLKIGLRTLFRFNFGPNAPNAEQRHWLSYPVTNHSVAGWGQQLRLPNQLRFKVRRADGEKRLVGVVFHTPHLPPQAFRPSRDTVESVWAQVHGFLDDQKHLSRIPE